ncbi:MAG: hypothetical protein WAO02_16665 [Verrucomicrobiia bacterium]
MEIAMADGSESKIWTWSSNPADFDGLHLVLPGDATQERPEPMTQCRGDERPSLLGAENTMKIGTDVGHGIHSAVPAELMQFLIFPALKRRAIFTLSISEKKNARLGWGAS